MAGWLNYTTCDNAQWLSTICRHTTHTAAEQCVLFLEEQQTLKASVLHYWQAISQLHRENMTFSPVLGPVSPASNEMLARLGLAKKKKRVLVRDETSKQRDQSAFCCSYIFCRQGDHLLLKLQNPEQVSHTTRFGGLGCWCCFLPCFIIDAKQTLLYAAPEPLHRGYSCYLYSLNLTYYKIALRLITEHFSYSDEHWMSFLKVK